MTVCLSGAGGLRLGDNIKRELSASCPAQGAFIHIGINKGRRSAPGKKARDMYGAGRL